MDQEEKSRVGEAQQAPAENTGAQKPAKKKRRQESALKKILRIVISLILIGGGIYLVLLLISKAALYDSIGSMLRHMAGELELMWERITS